MIVRPIGESELAELLLLATESFRETYRGIHEAAEIEEYIRENFSVPKFRALGSDPQSTLLGGFSGSSLLGYSLLSQTVPPQCVEAERPIELVRLYLNKSLLGRGYGTILLNATLDEAKRLGMSSVWLDVYERNEPAVEFYKRRGFTMVGRKEYLFGGQAYLDPVYCRMLQTNDQRRFFRN